MQIDPKEFLNKIINQPSMKSVVFKRFLRGAVAGATGMMIPLLPTDVVASSDLEAWLIKLGLAGIVGLISGAVLAADKWARWKE